MTIHRITGDIGDLSRFRDEARSQKLFREVKEMAARRLKKVVAEHPEIARKIKTGEAVTPEEIAIIAGATIVGKVGGPPWW